MILITVIFVIIIKVIGAVINGTEELVKERKGY